MELNVYKTKFKLLFDKFVSNNYELNSYYAEHLLKYLQNSSDKDINKLLETPFFTELLLRALANIDNTTESVKIFIMNLHTLLMRNEIHFSKLLHMKGVYILPEGHNRLKNNSVSPAFRLACIKQATVQIKHTSGVYWILEHKIWQQILKNCFDNQSHYVVTASYDFLKQFVWKLNELSDETNLVLVLEAILKPVMTSAYKETKQLTPEMEETLIAQVKPSFVLLLAILYTEHLSKVDKVVHLLARYFIIDAHLYLFLEATRDAEFAGLTSEIHLMLTFVTTSTFVIKPPQDTDLAQSVAYFNIISTLVHKRMISVIIDFSIKSILFWSQYGKAVSPNTFQRYGRTFAIDLQLIVILLVPFMCYTDFITTFLDTKPDSLTNYIWKLTEISSEQIVKCCYLFKTLVEDSDKKKVLIMTAKQLTRLKGKLSNEQAGIIFQALFYVLKRHVPTDEAGALILIETKVKLAEDAKLLSLVIDVIKMILNEHDINWYESYEVVCLYNTCLNLLKPKTLPSRLVMQALDLITITVKKFLTPDLTLLMESKSGSALNEIGEIIRQCMTDEEWEVRDSGLQLLLTCTELSFVKYIPFQKLISANNLIVEAARASCHDPEFYVQATALRCITAASRLDSIWKEVLTIQPSLYVELTYIVQRHPEGIVRKEAVLALTEIFMSQKITEEFKKLIYNIMSNAALKDLHWEVQLAALGFWRKAIQSHLSYRGMIDGKFPSVTFSREKRKIITLNREEIQKQLINILKDLALIGCLSVLNQCMAEDSNIKVMELAYIVAKELLEVLEKYNLTRVPESSIYFPVDKVYPKPEPIDNDVPMDLSLPQDYEMMDNRDEIIDSIVNTNHVDLLNHMYENQADVKVENTEDEILRNLTGYHVMDPNEFLDNFRNNNFLGIIEEKKKWNSGVRDLNSVLDEILSLDQSHLGCHNAECT